MVEGLIKELRRYNDVSPYELFVVSCPLDQGLELFVGVPSERYPAHLESRFLPGRHYATFNLQGEIDYATNEAWYYIESSLQLTLPYERNSCMLRFIHSIFHLTTHSQNTIMVAY